MFTLFGLCLQFVIAVLIFRRCRLASFFLMGMTLLDLFRYVNLYHGWYIYWEARSYDLIFIAILILHQQKDLVLDIASKSGVALSILLVLYSWTYFFKDLASMTFFIVQVGSIILMILGASLFASKRDMLSLGTLLWPMCAFITSYNLSLFPYLSLLPLLTWGILSLLPGSKHSLAINEEDTSNIQVKAKKITNSSDSERVARVKTMVVGLN